MKDLASDISKDVVVMINDYNYEYVDAIKSLSKKLGRKITGLILVDKNVAGQGLNKPDTDKIFEQIICDFEHTGTLSHALRQVKDRVLLITSSSERNQPYMKKVLPHFPYLLGPTEQSLDWSTHKVTMRELLLSYNPALVPKFMQITENSKEHIKKIESNLKYPVIVKPTGLAASILVNKAHNTGELENYLKQSFGVIDETYRRDRGRGKPSMVIEEFITGDMYSIDAYINEHGEAWCLPIIKVTTAYSIGKEGFYSYRLDTKHDLSDQQVAAANSAATQAMRALGLKSSTAHIELFDSPDGWKIIELGPRAGGYRQDMYWYGYGIDHAYNELLVKSGLKPVVHNNNVSYCSGINVYADTEGPITQISGLEEASKIESVVWLKQYHKVGDKAVFCGNGGKYIFDGILASKDLDKLNRDNELVRKTLKIVTK